MKNPIRVILKNAFANIARGVTTAMVALILPHFLTQRLTHDRFNCWSLILQIAAYASFLDFGLQIALSRFVTRAQASGQFSERDRFVSTASLLLSIAGVLSMIAICAVVWQAPALFKGLPAADLQEFRFAALLMGFSACLALPFSTWTSVLVGLHRNEVPALAISLSRIAGVICVLIAVRFTQSLVILSTCIVCTNILGSLAQYVAVRQLLPELRVRLSVITREAVHEFVRYCTGLSAWAFSMLLISGLDITIVAHYRFGSVGAYTLAAMITTFLSGMNQAAVSATLTPAAEMHALNQSSRARTLFFQVTFWNSTVMFAVTGLLILFGRPAMELWVGPAYANDGYAIMVCLALAIAIRLVANPYSTNLVALAQHAHGVPPSLIEAVVNLTLSIVGIHFLGAFGVALGTFVGAIVGLIGTLLYTVPRVEPVFHVTRRDMVRLALIKPVVAALPVFLLLFLIHSRLVLLIPTAVVACLATLAIGTLWAPASEGALAVDAKHKLLI